jgi:hypothetical protein
VTLLTFDPVDRPQVDARDGEGVGRPVSDWEQRKMSLDTKTLTRAALAGLVLQIAMVITGHFVAFVALHVFMWGGMAISALAGLLYGRASVNLSAAVVGGAIAGASCAIVGIAISVALRDTAPAILLLGTFSSGVTGAIGGSTGRALLGAPSEKAV